MERQTGIQPGEQAPDFSLQTTDGTQLHLQGRPVLLHFVSYTCPVTRGAVVPMRCLHDRYGDRVDFVDIVVRQAHPGEHHDAYNCFDDKMADACARQQQAQGLTPQTAELVAHELTAHDAFAAHVQAELGIDPDELTNPWHAAIASALSFSLGALLPVLAIILPPASFRIPVTFVVVLLALGLTGSLSARIGGAPQSRAVARVVVGGALAMLVTFGIGRLVGATGI